MWWPRKSMSKEIRAKRLIVISGCDSGLGLSIAYWSRELGYRVLAGCLNENGEGAQMLKDSSCDVISLDVTKSESLEKFKDKCDEIIGNGEGIELWAVVLNAGIGAFAEFFWQTDNQTKQMMDVNFWGSVNLAKSFRSLLLQHKSRLIVITSDCANYPLPGLAIYCASKAALQTWAVSLRRELVKYGVSVVSFQPGDFPMKSRIFARQTILYEEMREQMSEEELEFYGKYFDAYNNKLIELFSKTPAPIAVLKDENQRKAFISLLEDSLQYKSVVIYEKLAVTIFHFMLQYFPTRVSDFLIAKMLRFAEWNSQS